MLAHQPAHAAAERDPGNADGPGVPERRHETKRVGRARVLAGEDASVGPGGPLHRVDLHVAHRRQVEDERSVAGTVATHAVAARSDDQRQAPLLGMRHDERDVIRVSRTDDQGGMPVDGRIVDAAGALVVIGVGRDHAAPKPRSKPRRVPRRLLKHHGRPPSRLCYRGGRTMPVRVWP